jgi:hypothetical protein
MPTKTKSNQIQTVKLFSLKSLHIPLNPVLIATYHETTKMFVFGMQMDGRMV